MKGESMEFSDEQIAAAAQLAGPSLIAEECALDACWLSRPPTTLHCARSRLQTMCHPRCASKCPLPRASLRPLPTARTLPALTRPAPDELPFASIAAQAVLLRNRQISAVELADLYLARLERYDPALHCVITRTAEFARAQAQRADAELAWPARRARSMAFPARRTCWRRAAPQPPGARAVSRSGA